MSRPTLAQARAQYVHRYTSQHVPSWARRQAPNGRWYAPQFATDAEWYAATTFPEEPGFRGDPHHCETNRPTWPLGQWLDEPFRGHA